MYHPRTHDIDLSVWGKLGDAYLNTDLTSTKKLITGWMVGIDSKSNSIIIDHDYAMTTRHNPRTGRGSIKVSRGRERFKTTFRSTDLLPDITINDSMYESVRIAVSIVPKLVQRDDEDEGYDDEDDERLMADITHMAVYVNKDKMNVSWSTLNILPHYRELLKLTDFFDFAPEFASPSAAASHVIGVNWILPWLRAQESGQAVPVYNGPATSAFIPVPGTTAVLHTVLERVVDESVIPNAFTSVPCPGGALIGAPGTGKFTSCVLHALRAHKSQTVRSWHPRTSTYATLFIVPASGVGWRQAQLRTMPECAGKNIVSVLTKQDLMDLTWDNLLQADIILTSAQLIVSRQYISHANHVINQVVEHPEQFVQLSKSGPQKSQRTTNKRRRLDVGLPLSPRTSDALMKTFDVEMKTPSQTTSLCSDHRYSLQCVRRLLDYACCRWEDLKSPVLEVISYARVVYVDSDRQDVYVNRMKAFSGRALFLTASSLLEQDASLVLPHELDAKVERPKTSLIQSFVQQRMVCNVRPPPLPRSVITDHMLVPMTSREMLVSIDEEHENLHLSPATEIVLSHLQFVKKPDMMAHVTRASHEHVSTLHQRRDTLQANIERNNQIFQITGDGNGLMLFIDDDGDDDESFLEIGTERLSRDLDAVNSEIASHERDADVFHTRVQNTIDTAIEKESCVICSTTACDAILACGHVFCVHCITKWYDEKETCPTCNTNVQTIIALDTYTQLPCPISDPNAAQRKLWSRVWKSQTLSSVTFWFLHTLQTVEGHGTRAVVILQNSTDARNLVRVLASESVQLRFLSGPQAARRKTIKQFSELKCHVVVLASEVLSGAGFPHVSDVVMGARNESTDASVLSRFQTRKRVYTFESVRG